MKDRETVLKELDGSRQLPPSDFVDRVMAALPAQPEPTWRARLAVLWPRENRWLVPSMAGVLAALLAILGFLLLFRPPVTSAVVTVTLELDAPDAKQVELVGSFNQWRTGEIPLARPDGNGPWRVTMELPPGRHEYLFLVDGQRWMTDPRAVAYRADGFGNRNAVLAI